MYIYIVHMNDGYSQGGGAYALPPLKETLIAKNLPQ